MVKARSRYFKVFSFILIVFVALTQGGCETLQKKFTRKKKDNKKNQIIPILEPVDYSKQADSPLKNYAFHYSLWKVWQKDLLKALEEKNTTDKSFQYLVEQLVIQLQEMQKIASADKHARFDEVIADYRKLIPKLLDPISLRRTYNLDFAIERLGKQVKHELGLKTLGLPEEEEDSN